MSAWTEQRARPGGRDGVRAPGCYRGADRRLPAPPGPGLGARSLPRSRAGDLVAFVDEPVSSGGCTLTGGRSPWENRTAVGRDFDTSALASSKRAVMHP